MILLLIIMMMIMIIVVIIITIVLIMIMMYETYNSSRKLYFLMGARCLLSIPCLRARRILAFCSGGCREGRHGGGEGCLSVVRECDLAGSLSPASPASGPGSQGANRPSNPLGGSGKAGLVLWKEQAPLLQSSKFWSNELQKHPPEPMNIGWTVQTHGTGR